MIISIASGKGGTGKTTFAVNLAYFLSEKQQVALLDCDVEEPNDHLFLNVEKYNQRPVAVPHPIFEKAKCNGCGKCVEVCNFNALAIAKDVPMIFNELCHSCGACGYLCPEMAISETQYQIGSIFQPFNNVLPFDFAYGLLNIGEVLAPEIIKQLKKGHLRSEYTNIIDASPGIGCTVVESLDKAGAAVLITEPTPFGLHDLELALELTRKMQIPAGIVINRSDGVDKIIANFAEKAKIPLLGRIPFDRKYAEAYSKGEVLIKRFPEFRKQISLIYQNILLLEKMEISPNQYEGENVIFPAINVGIQAKGTGTKETVIISGKGGTGKTTITAALAQLKENQVLFDADVDASDLELLIKAEKSEVFTFKGGQKAVIDAEKCSGCGKCSEMCRFDSIALNGPGNDVIGQTYQVDASLCEGCGLCKHLCPVEAITVQDCTNGKLLVSSTENGTMVHAELGVGEENSGKLVSAVRSSAWGMANADSLSDILGDGPPGTGCPVIASVNGIERVIIVTEPTVSGLHDLKRVMQLCDHFRIKPSVIINKADLNNEIREKIYLFSMENGGRVIAEIPFDKNIHSIWTA